MKERAAWEKAACAYNHAFLSGTPIASDETNPWRIAGIHMKAAEQEAQNGIGNLDTVRAILERGHHILTEDDTTFGDLDELANDLDHALGIVARHLGGSE